MSRSAKDVVIKLLAIRDHSEAELRTKLEQRDFTPDEIEAALDFGRKSKLLAPPDALSERIAENLHRASKGIEYINQYLEKKGLSSVSSTPELELEKALVILRSQNPDELSGEEKKKWQGKMARKLVSRGFSEDVIRKVIYGDNEIYD
ncbi:MAG: regulatory protein RecX [Pseudobdellovibrionaceae bacterium]